MSYSLLIAYLQRFSNKFHQKFLKAKCLDTIDHNHLEHFCYFLPRYSNLCQLSTTAHHLAATFNWSSLTHFSNQSVIKKQIFYTFTQNHNLVVWFLCLCARTFFCFEKKVPQRGILIPQVLLRNMISASYRVRRYTLMVPRSISRQSYLLGHSTVW